MSVNKKNYSALLLVLSVFTLPGISGKAEAQVTTLRCDGPDFGDECSLNEMYNVAGVLFFTELNFQIAFPFLPPSSDDFNTDLSQVKVIPLEGFPGPGIRIEPLPGTWAIDGNESLSNQKVLAELRMLGGSSSASEAIPTDQVRYKFETTTTYVSGVVPDCDNNFGGSGGFVDGSLSVAGQIIGQAQSVNFGGIEFGAPPDRMDYRNSQGENISQATGEINFQGDLTFLRAVEIFNLTFTVADCGTAAANSAELVAIELRFVDTESVTMRNPRAALISLDLLRRSTTHEKRHVVAVCRNGTRGMLVLGLLLGDRVRCRRRLVRP